MPKMTCTSCSYTLCNKDYQWCPKCWGTLVPTSELGRSMLDDKERSGPTITFACPVCATKYSVAAYLAGRRTACAKCREKLIVPTLNRNMPPEQQATAQPPRLKGKRVRAIAAATAFVGIAFIVWLVTSATDSSKPQPQTPPQAIRDPKVEQLAEAERRLAKLEGELQSEREQRKAEAAKLAADAARQEAQQISEKALARLAEQAVAITKLDKMYRDVVSKGDKDGMMLFAQADVQPTERDDPTVKKFYASRQKFIREKSEALAEMLVAIKATAREAMVALSEERFSANASTRFEEVADARIRELEAKIKAEYPDPTLHYGEAVASVKVARGLARQERIRLSKEAEKAFLEHCKTVPRTSDVVPSDLSLARTVLFLRKLETHLHEGKLTKEAAQEAFNEWHRLGRELLDAQAMRDTLMISGEFRPGHDPDFPSFAEAFLAFKQHVDYDGWVKWHTELNQRR